MFYSVFQDFFVLIYIMLSCFIKFETRNMTVKIIMISMEKVFLLVTKVTEIVNVYKKADACFV